MPGAPPATAEIVPAEAGTPDEKAARLAIAETSPFGALMTSEGVEHLWRLAKIFSASDMVPSHFRKHTENCFVAIQMAVRLHVDPMMFLQGTYVIQGKPAMEAKLAIALVNSRGPFTGPIQYTLSGEGMGRKCIAHAVHAVTSERCEVEVTIAMAKAEGWYDRNPKWKNLADLMLRYRSAAWLARLYAPETLLGMVTLDEAEDTAAAPRIQSSIVSDFPEAKSRTEALSKSLGAQKAEKKDAQPEVKEAKAEEPTEKPKTTSPSTGVLKDIEERLMGLYPAQRPMREIIITHIFGQPLAKCTLTQMESGVEPLANLQDLFDVSGRIKDPGDLAAKCDQLRLERANIVPCKSR